MRNKILGLIILWALAFSPLQGWAHDFHTSITDARYNARTKTYELAVRVFADDLENALSRRNKTNVRLDRSERVKKLIAEYLQANLSIAGAKGELPQQKFLGLQEESDAVWLYLEIPAAKAPAGQVWVQNALLTEIFDDQMNILNLEVAGKKHSILAKYRDTQHTISL
ncbi:DUF6702 family protein [Rufibacter roseus]|uniref:DUF6702 family protein n=1 Tax=Rufibacter roseus TaxID=1567108 RepID=A0ABW2DMX2_9BACT|nr:DUF6702 family protein [Rufibacter roseus]